MKSSPFSNDHEIYQLMLPNLTLLLLFTKHLMSILLSIKFRFSEQNYLHMFILDHSNNFKCIDVISP